MSSSQLVLGIDGMTGNEVRFGRSFDMPDPNTFQIPTIRTFIERYWSHGAITVDPFARSSCYAPEWSNDLDPATSAKYHMDAIDFLDLALRAKVQADIVFIDPPYSPIQIARCYKAAGREVGRIDTQNGRLMRFVKDRATKLCKVGGVALSFGWNSVGMGIGRGFIPVEILMVNHGGVHNDTIC